MAKKPKKKSLLDEVEVSTITNAPIQPEITNRAFLEQPIPSALKDHLEVLFEEMKFEEMPNFDLTSPEEAKKASLHFARLQEVIEQRQKQIIALRTALESTSMEMEPLPVGALRKLDN